MVCKKLTYLCLNLIKIFKKRIFREENYLYFDENETKLCKKMFRNIKSSKEKS